MEKLILVKLVRRLEYVETMGLAINIMHIFMQQLKNMAEIISGMRYYMSI